MPKAQKPSVPASVVGRAIRYLSEIRKFPCSRPKQEYMLAKRYQEHEDSTAASW